MKSELNFFIKKTNGDIFDMDDIGVWVDSFQIHSPDAERETKEALRSHGLHLVSSRIKQRKISISFTIETNSIHEFNDIKHRVFEAFYSDEPFGIYRDLFPNKVLYAIQEGAYDINSLTPEDGDFSIELTMYDPFIYGTEETMSLENIPIVNKGTADASPIFNVTFTSPASEIKISHQETGGVVHVIWDFIAGDKLVIDLAKRKVIINGRVRMAAYVWSNRPFKLKSGVNHLNVSPANNANTIVKFRPRWL